MRRPRWWPVPAAGPGRARLPDGRTLRLLTAQELLDNGAKVLIAHPMELLNTISEFN